MSTTNVLRRTWEEGPSTTVSKIGYSCTETDSINIFCKNISKSRTQSLKMIRQRNCHLSVLKMKIFVVLIRFENTSLFEYTIYSKSTVSKWRHINFITRMYGSLHSAASIICTIVSSDQEHTNVICIIWSFPFVKIMNNM